MTTRRKRRYGLSDRAAAFVQNFVKAFLAAGLTNCFFFFVCVYFVYYFFCVYLFYLPTFIIVTYLLYFVIKCKASPEEKFQIASYFITQSPPGEVDFVVSGMEKKIDTQGETH